MLNSRWLSTYCLAMVKRGMALMAVLLLTGCEGDISSSVSVGDARACLLEEHLLVEGGPDPPDDTSAPGDELIVMGREAGAFLAFYPDEQLARRKAPWLDTFRGTLERHGKLSIVWVRGPKGDDATKIRRCIL